MKNESFSDRLEELREMFKPLPSLNEEERIENEILYWERIQRETKQYGWDRQD